MDLYALYRFGQFLAMSLPVRASYWIACSIADIWYLGSSVDRHSVIANLERVTGTSDRKKLKKMAREVFRNFGKYLADFFRFSKIDLDYIKRFVKVEGIENLDNAMAQGKGVIVLSAHLGNWELGGLAVSYLRRPIMAVALTHDDSRINNFFTRQRKAGKVVPVEIGITLRSCYKVLAENGLLALLGDRDFSGKGVYMDFFGKEALIPKGPASLSARLGSIIVPSFLIREDDDTFTLKFEPAIKPPQEGDEETRIKEIMKRSIAVIEKYIRLYPAQWSMFRKAWKE